jgi:hypothetical protein
VIQENVSVLTPNSKHCARVARIESYAAKDIMEW